MPIATYGDYGFALLLVPTAAADYLEYERFQLMDTWLPLLMVAKSKCIPSTASIMKAG